MRAEIIKREGVVQLQHLKFLRCNLQKHVIIEDKGKNTTDP